MVWCELDLDISPGTLWEPLGWNDPGSALTCCRLGRHPVSRKVYGVGRCISDSIQWFTQFGHPVADASSLAAPNSCPHAGKWSDDPGQPRGVSATEKGPRRAGPWSSPRPTEGEQPPYGAAPRPRSRCPHGGRHEERHGSRDARSCSSGATALADAVSPHDRRLPALSPPT